MEEPSKGKAHYKTSCESLWDEEMEQMKDFTGEESSDEDKNGKITAERSLSHAHHQNEIHRHYVCQTQAYQETVYQIQAYQGTTREDT
jgi:hypothetical protein